MVKLTEHKSLSHETVRRRLAENGLKPWRKDMWCIPQVDGEYVARMEDVLELYAEEPDPKRPVVCFDESPTQLIGEAHQPIPAEPGQVERYDCEYKRNGTANLFIFLEAHQSWRKVKVTDRHAAEDFAVCMRELTDVHFQNHSIKLRSASPHGKHHRALPQLGVDVAPPYASFFTTLRECDDPLLESPVGLLRPSAGTVTHPRGPQPRTGHARRDDTGDRGPRQEAHAPLQGSGPPRTTLRCASPTWSRGRSSVRALGSSLMLLRPWRSLSANHFDRAF